MRLASLAFALLALAALAGCHSTASPQCGACPVSYSCGSANGLAVCRRPSGVPLLKHVFLIMMENTSLTTLQASTRAPYLASLAAKGAVSTNYHGVAHPSLPNYLALTSGSTQGVSCDCSPAGPHCTSTCSESCACNIGTSHLGDQLESAGLTWRAYGEDMGTACNMAAANLYAPKHVPFLYYDNVQTNAARCGAHVVDFAANFATDLAAAPSFVFIAPNLENDMHNLHSEKDKNIASGDTWLSKVVPQILASAAYQDGGVLVIAWDEDDFSGLVAVDDPVPFYLLSPYAKAGFSSTVRADHYSLLATIAEGLRLAPLIGASTATTLGELFAAQ